jgi:hypothetical protein
MRQARRLAEKMRSWRRDVKERKHDFGLRFSVPGVPYFGNWSGPFFLFGISFGLMYNRAVLGSLRRVRGAGETGSR